MKYKLADDAKPQVTLLLIATLITVGLWFIPYAEYLVYPIRLFVTFVHESSHALIAVLTGGAVQSLTISSDGSGVVYSMPSGLIGQAMTSSAGYIGATVFGVVMLILIRRSFSPHKMLFGLGASIGVMTILFGIVSPIFNFLTLQVAFSTVLFTVVSGSLLSAGLIALARFSSLRVANFSVAFLAVQCLLNSLSDLKTVLFVNAPLIGSDIQNDAANMAAATGLPAFIWVVVWIAIAVVVITLGLRMFAVARGTKPSDSVFND
jgi:hypothetical protein